MKFRHILFICVLLLIVNSIYAAKTKAKAKAKAHLKSYLLRRRVQNSQDKPSEVAADAKPEGDAAAAKGGIIKEGWLKVSSEDLINEARYAAIPTSFEKGEGGQPKSFKRVQLAANVIGAKADGSANDSPTFFRKNEQYAEGGEIPDESSFWFRLSGRNLYYTATKKDMNVLGAIGVVNLDAVDDSNINVTCFKVTNQENDKWDVCTATTESKQEWMCAILKALGQECGAPKAKETTVVVHDIQKQPIILLPLPSPFCNEDWNYMSHGDDWNCKCREGFTQSPVDVPISRMCKKKPGKYTLNKSAIFKWKKVDLQTVSLVYETNIVRLKCKGDEDDCSDFSMGNLIDIDFMEYEAQEIQFHTPADHTLDGDNYPMEIQVIFKPVSSGNLQSKAIVSFLAKKKPGIKNKFFENFDMLNLPNQAITKTNFAAKESVSVEDLFVWDDHEDDYQGYFGYIYYEGSLTAPPCDEHVRWFVVDEPINTGMATIEMLKDAVVTVPKIVNQDSGMAALGAGDLYPKNPEGNNRILQQLNDRVFYHFDLENNDCYPHQKPEDKNKNPGHFEKVEVKANSYVYVPSDQPSGLPNSVVVTKEEAFGKKKEKKGPLIA